jgi:hypothetical protein
MTPVKAPLSYTNKWDTFKKVKRNCNFKHGKFLSIVKADLSAFRSSPSTLRSIFVDKTKLSSLESKIEK